MRNDSFDGRPDIQMSYIDALGRRRSSPRGTVRALRDILSQGTEGSRAHRANEEQSAAIVVRQGRPEHIGPAEVTLEDGTGVTVDARLPVDLPQGYHTIRRKGQPPGALVVTPRSCYLPEEFRTWGWVIQVYAARSRRSWGIGDLADLRWLGRWAAARGAGLALVNPLSAPTPTLPQQPSPYFPSTRRFRDPLYLRITDVDGATSVRLDDLEARGLALNDDRLIARDEVFRIKLEALGRIWQTIAGQPGGAFGRFVVEQGDALEQFAVFCMLAERHGPRWQAWPAELRHPASPAVRRIAHDSGLRNRVQFFQWLQFQIDRQLLRAARALPVMQDLPIGFDPQGADAWAYQDVLALDVSIGAPPDEFNTKGQDWGLPPFVPARLRAAGYGPFAATIRACLRHAGGLRIDHVMGLFRQFWIPRRADPAHGAFVRLPSADLLAIVALESARARAVIVGEDLGTVEEDVRRRLRARAILSYRLVWFEKVPPSRYPVQALAAVTTHDLPTIAGLWSGSDLAAQHRLGLAPNEQGTASIRGRVKRMARATTVTPVRTIVSRVHAALASAPSRILAATLEDAMQVEERPNMPATRREWPNWSMALPMPIETLSRNALAEEIARGLRRRRRAR